MCGIYGRLVTLGSVDEEESIRRRDVLAHRGPDSAGLWVDHERRVVLAHRRLAIIDLSPAGHQPMTSQCGQAVIVFNGEVYNYREIRRELEAEGRTFRSDSDTEVVLEAYLNWGEDCLHRFNGMFAFAIWRASNSEREGELFFARDRVGKKPFYYSHRDGGFEFASELKALVPAGPLDLEAINHYLALGYIPHHLSLLSGVSKLPPGHAGRFRMGAEVTVWRYWSLPPLELGRASPSELSDEVERLLLDSVRLRLRSDVPVGVLLSGGLDSSLITAATAMVSERPPKTFTISFPGTRYDEARHAALVARHFGTDHHVLEVPKPSLELLSELAPLIDEPIADSSILPSFLVSRLTRSRVTVALGGDGGDELFGGYSHYLSAVRDSERLKRAPRRGLELLARTVALLPAGVKGRARVAALREGPERSIVWGTPYFDLALRRRILSKDALRSLGATLDAPERWLASLYDSGTDLVDRMTRTDFQSILPDDYLVKIDRASMAVSLELRAPLLDYRLVELAFSRIPSHEKVDGRHGRKLERRLAGKLLPSAIDLERKQGFSIPLDEWLRDTDCAAVREVSHALPGCIVRTELDQIIAGQLAGRANGGRLFGLVCLGLAARNLAAGRAP